jgi:hypothetical protein
MDENIYVKKFFRGIFTFMIMYKNHIISTSLHKHWRAEKNPLFDPSILRRSEYVKLNYIKLC